MKIDLHVHSAVSDGAFTPHQLIHYAHQAGFELLALCDHDCVSGIADAKAAASRANLSLLSGIELSCSGTREIHILGYGINENESGLQQFCSSLIDFRKNRASLIIQKLARLGIFLDEQAILSSARGAAGKPHIAQEMIRQGYVHTMQEAFAKYLDNGKPADVPKQSLTVEEAIQIIHAAEGVAVLAHPMELQAGAGLADAIHTWKARGLDGIEVYHPSATTQQAADLHSLARKEHLLITGGSDFHREGPGEHRLGEGLDRWQTVQEDIETLLRRIQR